LSLRALAGAAPWAFVDAYARGPWHFDGSRTLPDLPPTATELMAQRQRFDSMSYRPATVGHLEAALWTLRGADVRVYLSPMSRPQRALASAAGRDGEIARWRADIAAAARRVGVPLSDLVDRHGFDDFDPARGSSRFWLDNAHFKPAVGRWILGEVGVATRVGAGSD
jgi:hypothetical protein